MELPRSITLLNDYQKTFLDKELRKIEEDSKNFIKNYTSPMTILIRSEEEHRLNHTIPPFEWLLIYTGQDITHILIVLFALFPFLFQYWVTYLFRFIKPEVQLTPNENFPIIPLIYLQQTKDEQRVIRTRRNSIHWIYNRYIIMASDNVVDIRLANVINPLEEQMRSRRHQAWALLRLLAKFNVLYTRTKSGRKGNRPSKIPPDVLKRLEEYYKHQRHKHVDLETGIDVKTKHAELIRLRRLRLREKELRDMEYAERVTKRKEVIDYEDEMGGNNRRPNST